MLNHCPARIDFDVYEPRNPQASHYFRCVETHFEQLEVAWLPARRAYSSERITATRIDMGFGVPM